MFGGFYNSLYGDLTDAPLRDWSHSNALAYNPADDSVIMSLRHQDALAKIDLATGDLIWLLGTADNWNEPWSSKRLQPTGEIEWQYHQHGSSFSGTGSIMLFDNGLPRGRKPYLDFSKQQHNPPFPVGKFRRATRRSHCGEIKKARSWRADHRDGSGSQILRRTRSLAKIGHARTTP